MADPWADVHPVRVRELLALGVLRGASVIGGSGGLERRVSEVVVASDFDLGTPPSGALIIVDGSALHDDTYQVDLALRALSEADGSALVVIAPAARIGIATARLANKLRLPVVVGAQGDPLRMGDSLRTVVVSPRSLASEVITRSLHVLRRATESAGAGGTLTAIEDLLDGSATLVGAEGTEVAGAVLDPPLEEKDRLPVAIKERHGTVAQVTQPISLAPRERPSFWLVVRRTDATETWLEAASSVLQVAAWCLGTRLVTDRLQRERDARFRLGVLNAITASSDHPEPALLEQIGVLGWNVSDWCTAVHVHVAGADQQRVLSLTEDLQRVVDQAGLNTTLIERPDGWTFWTTSPNEPPPSSYVDLVRSLRKIAWHFIGSYKGLQVYVGVGHPYQSLPGLQKSLSEARESSIIAHAGGGDAVVQHVDELGVKRILLGWYASETFAEFARTLLGPLVAADPHGELLVTLEAFLDNESSPTETSVQLGIHRNTVLNRMERARSLLTVDLDDRDGRLAVQLACRVFRLKSLQP